MKNFTQNVYSKIILGVIAILLISAAYYFAIYLPKHKGDQSLPEKMQTAREDFLLSKKEECRKVGMEKEVQERQFMAGAANILPAQYAYNENLNSCLISFMMIWTDTQKTTSYTIEDSLTNATYARYSEVNGKPDLMSCKQGSDCIASLDAFKQERYKLMGF